MRSRGGPTGRRPNSRECARLRRWAAAPSTPQSGPRSAISTAELRRAVNPCWERSWNDTRRAAPRWFELRGSGTTWSLFQQGTYDPDATVFRFMGSIAQDGRGDIALGVTVDAA